MRAYPYSIENGAGERLTFARRIPGPGGDRVEGENLVAPGAGPPMHVHHLQEEALTVLEGRLGYQVVGREPAFAGEGDLRCSAYIAPVGNVEYFLGAVFESQRSNQGRRPGLFDVAFLTRRYRSEFAMLAIPAAVQRLVFPVVVAVGRALGKYGKFADAPAPMGR